jgi:hypothetical protein
VAEALLGELALQLLSIHQREQVARAILVAG